MHFTRPLQITLVCVFTALAFHETNAQLPTPESLSTSPQRNGSTIRGRVVYADTGRPLRRAKVRVVYPEQAETRFENVTDRKGEFVVQGLPAGRYFLGVEAPGIISPGLYFRRDTSILNEITFGESRDLFHEVFVNGKDNADVQIRATRGGVIAGKVTFEDDQPVADAEIRLLSRKLGKLYPVSGTWERYSGSKIKTDSQGMYRIAGLAEGEYLVRVSERSVLTSRAGDDDEAYGDGSFMVCYYPSATTIKNAQTVRLAEGSQVTGIDIRMPERNSRTISGVISFGPDNEPAGFVELRLDRLEEQRPAIYVIVDGTTRSDELGRWELRGIPDGDYVIILGGTARIGTREGGGHVDIPTMSIPVKIDGSDVLNLNTHLNKGAYISGTLSLAGGRLRDRDFLSIDLINESLRSKTSTPDSTEIVWNKSRSSEFAVIRDNRFESKGLQPGKYWLQVSGIDPNEFYVKGITRNDVDLLQSPLNVSDGGNYSGIKVTLDADLAVLEGKVLTPKADQKKASKDVVIILVPAEVSGPNVNKPMRSFLTASDGSFTIKSGPGEYLVVAMTKSQINQLSGPLSQKYFTENKSIRQRIKVKAGENLKGLILTPQN